MKAAVTTDNASLEARVHPVFGRCPTYVLVDTESMAFEALANPAVHAPGGAGIRAAQFVVQAGAQAVITGNVGSNAFEVLESASVPVFLTEDGTVRQAVEALQAGSLQRLERASTATNTGRQGASHRRGAGSGAQITPRSGKE